jgi:hypothetical protein
MYVIGRWNVKPFLGRPLERNDHKTRDFVPRFQGPGPGRWRIAALASILLPT